MKKLAAIAVLVFITLIMAAPAFADVATQWIRKAGDFVNGPLQFKSPAAFPIVLNQPSSSITRGVCFSATGTPTSCSANINYAPGSGYMTLQAGAVTGNGALLDWGTGQITDGKTTHPSVNLNGGGGILMSGMAFASFPSCANPGILYDSTNNCFKFCNGSSWSACVGGSGTFVQQQTVDAARDVANITAGTCTTYNVSATGLFEAGDPCDVGFALSTAGGVAGTTWDCWPSDTTLITVRACCVAAADCNPASQTYTYTVTSPNGF